MRPTAALPALGLGLAIGAAALALDPQRSLTGPAAAQALVALAAAAGLGLAALGAGAALIRQIAPSLLEDGRGLLHASVAGIGLWGLGGLALAALGLLGPGAAIGLGALMATGWLRRPGLRLPVWQGPDALPLALAVALLFFLTPGLITALAPPTDTDELYYHLALPRELLAKGGLVGGMLRPDGNRPMALHLPYALVMALGGDSAPRLLHLGLAGLTLLGTAELGRAWLGRAGGVGAALLLAGSWTFSQEAGLASNNLPTALACLAAFDAARRGEARALAVAAGAALAIKYTAAGALAGAFLVAALPWRTRVLAGLGALAWVAPWWLRNLAEGLHPLFPFAGWPSLPGVDFAFQYPDKYGAGRDLRGWLLLPWNVVMGADPGSFRFLGRVNPAFLALLPFAALAWLRGPRAAAARPLALAGLVAGLAWALGPQWLRYLLPALPILALALAAALERPAARLAFAAAWLLGLPSNAGPLIRQAADRLPAATGQESREALLARSLSGWEAVAWCNTHLPPDATVALLFNWSGALLERPTLLGSVEDHVPTRYFLLKHGEQSLDALARAGATHALVSRVHFLAQLYPFLSKQDFQHQFSDPESLLERLLLREATLVFEGGRTRVYRLPDPASARSIGPALEAP